MPDEWPLSFLEMTMDLPSPLPPLYDGWMNELLPGPLPNETRASCQSCPMIKDEPEASLGNIYFNRRIKCCAYLPRLHNFLVGRILSGDDPIEAEGRATVEARIRAGVAVTPLGLEPTRTFTLLYESSSDAFGRNSLLKCPHYLEESGGCGVWRNRESTCVTWFCKHERGAAGQSFWRQYLQRLLANLEYELSRWCLLKLNLEEELLTRYLAPPLRASRSIQGAELDGQINAAEYRRNWGKWFGRERELYIACGELVSPLSWEQVLGICGPETNTLATLTRLAWQRLVTPKLYPALHTGPLQLAEMGRESSRVVSYSEFDPLEVPNPVMNLLHYFDGRPVAQVLAEILARENISLQPDLVQKLADFRVLVPAESHEST
jgi:hypothetical protein